MIKQNRTQPKPGPRHTGRAIDAMTPAQRQKLIDMLDSETPEQRAAKSRPVTPADQARMDRFVKKMGRPRLGKGTRVVSVTVEIDQLARADAYARKMGLKRAELFTQCLKCVLPENSAVPAFLCRARGLWSLWSTPVASRTSRPVLHDRISNANRRPPRCAHPGGKPAMIFARAEFLAFVYPQSRARFCHPLHLLHALHRPRSDAEIWRVPSIRPPSLRLDVWQREPFSVPA